MVVVVVVVGMVVVAPVVVMIVVAVVVVVRHTIEFRLMQPTRPLPQIITWELILPTE